MKKNYIQPQVNVVKTNLQTTILEGSVKAGAISLSGTDEGNGSDQLAKDDIFGEMDLNRAMEILEEFDW